VYSPTSQDGWGKSVLVSTTVRDVDHEHRGDMKEGGREGREGRERREEA
jgi:hypothetical protein